MLNQVQLIGRLGKDPELKYSQSGKAICKFSIATSERWKDKDGAKQERTEWHSVTVFDKLAEICGEYLKQGALVFVQGKIHTDKYTDKSGVEKRFTGINATEMKMLGNKGDASSDATPKAAVVETEDEYPSGDLPF